jgi:ketosteroid isomerase-like protein
MYEYENVNIVKKVYRAFSEANFEALSECLADDVKWFAIGPPELISTAGTRYGRKEVEQYFLLLEANGELQNFKPEEFIADNDTVVAIGVMRNQVRSTGSVITSLWAHVFRIRQGKISDFRSFHDTAAVIAARDSSPPLPPARMLRFQSLKRSFL